MKVRYCDSFCCFNSLILSSENLSGFPLTISALYDVCLSTLPFRKTCFFLCFSISTPLGAQWIPVVTIGLKRRFWLLDGGGMHICGESGPAGSHPKRPVWLPERREEATAGSHGIDVSVPTVEQGSLDGGIISKMRPAGVWEHFQMHSPLFFQASTGQLSCIRK